MPAYKSKDKTKDGRQWYYKCQYKNAYGENKTKKSKKFLSKKEASIAERQFLNECCNYNNNIIWDDLVVEFLSNSNNKDGTLYSKKINLNKYGDLFKNKNIDKINVKLIESWKKQIDTFDLATNSKQNIFNYFKTVLKYAEKKGYIIKNPFDMTDNFQKDPDKIEEKNEAELYIKPDEFDHFLTVIEDDFWKTFFSFAFYIGTRKGEQVALQWKDIDFKRKKVKIYKQLNIKGLKRKSLFIPTKNGVIRTISIPDKLLTMLLNLYECESKTYNFNDEWFVFGGLKYLSYTSIDRKKDYYFKKANIKRITMHQFRHSHASFLISNDVPLNIIAKRLGDTPEVILKTYAHLFPEKEEEVLIVLNKI